MKPTKRILPLLAAVAVAGLWCGTYMVAQTRTGDDATLLLDSLARNDYQTALEILRQHGVAEDTLLAMAERLPRTPVRVLLNEPFMRGTVSMPLEGHADEVAARIVAASAMGYGRLFWAAGALDQGWPARYDAQLGLFPTPPVGALDFNLGTTNFIEYFKWFDRYAEHLHSVAINWTHLDNYLRRISTADANRVLNGLFRLIKARKPGAFVWLGVVKMDDGSDLDWLRAMTFRPDGLLIWNLSEFQSAYELVPNRYWPVTGMDMPLVLADFEAYAQVLEEKGDRLKYAESEPDSLQRAEDRAQGLAELGGIGRVVGPNLGRLEMKLQAHGFRGLTADWLLIEALAHQDAPAAR